MYLEHFQLSSQPFSEHAAATSLWQDPRMDEGLARLEYLVQCGELGLVTGQSGVGKSAPLETLSSRPLLAPLPGRLLSSDPPAVLRHAQDGSHPTGRDAQARQGSSL